MKIAFAAAGALALAACAGPGSQAPMYSTDENTAALRRAMPRDALAAMDAAQAASSRSGDEALSCDAIMAETDAIMEDPAFEAAMTSLEASAGEEENFGGGVVTAGSLARTAGLTAAGTALAAAPGGAAVFSLLVRAQTATMSGQAGARSAEAAAMAAELNSIMPSVMRLQTLGELSVEKDCGFGDQYDEEG